MAIGPKTINNKAGKSFFNTTMKFSSVVRRKFELAKMRSASEIEGSESTDPWRNPEKHMMELGNIYDDSLIESLQSKFEKAIQEGENVRKVSHEGDVYARQLCSWDFHGTPAFDFGKHIPELENLINGEIIELLTQYYGAHIRPDFVKMYRNYHIPPEVVRETEIYSNYWHCDGYSVDGIKLFVNLNDVSENHGPFHIISRKDTKKLVGSDYDRREQGVPEKTVEKEAEVKKATGEAGTAMLANTNLCLHRADNPDEGKHRDLILINFIASEEPISDNWLDDYPLDRELG